MPCPSCGTEITAPHARWCGWCGARLPVGASPASARSAAPSRWSRARSTLVALGGVAALGFAVLVVASPDGAVDHGTGSEAPSALGDVDLDGTTDAAGGDGGEERLPAEDGGPDTTAAPGDTTADPGGTTADPEDTADLGAQGTDEVTLPPPPMPAAPALEGGAAELDPGPARWSARLPAPVVDVVLGDDLVVAATGTSAHAFESSDGAPRWEIRFDEGIVSALDLADERVVVTQKGQGIVGLDPASGEVAWRLEGPVQTATVAGEVVVVGDGTAVEGVAVDDGRRLWRRGLPGFVAAGAPGEVVGVATDDRVHGFDVATGETRWEIALRPRGSAHQSDELLVVGSRSGFSIVDVDTGVVRASVRQLRDLGDRVRGQPRVVDDGVVAAVGNGIVRFDDEGTPRWRAETHRQAWLLREPNVVATVEAGVRLVLMDPATGAQVLQRTPSGWFTAMAVGERDLALAVHTPTLGHLDVHDVHDLVPR
jgi:outer membrane protein assembly factor BamB